MKISRLHLRAFGGFTNHTLEFSATPGVVELIYGPNEAGKSTMRRGCCDLMFGIPNDTQDDFVHPTNSLRIGAELVDEHGTEQSVYRRKGRSGTLQDAGGNRLDDTVLTAMLGAVDRRTYATMFGLDHLGLQEGGREILEGKGEAGLIIFQAGTGIAQLRKLREQLAAEADERVSPTGAISDHSCHTHQTQ